MQVTRVALGLVSTYALGDWVAKGESCLLYAQRGTVIVPQN
jgi:hypothetical protein